MLRTPLPDVASAVLPSHQASINWVGMDDISVPVYLNEPAGQQHSHANASIAVDLPGGEGAARGIHMSRLYFLLNELSQLELNPQSLEQCLTQVLATHKDLGTSAARIELQFDFLLKRPALITNSGGGWQRYPINLSAELVEGKPLSINLQLEFQYSSTCPCSAALVRESLAQNFLQQFNDEQAISPSQVAEWLKKNGTLATPHSQRSVALVSSQLPNQANALGLVKLIEQLESITKTPLQTSVKRADEQAFAELNGQNLMFVEDISRRLTEQLRPHYPSVAIQVRHLESLHAHNAFAQVLPSNTAVHPQPQFTHRGRQ
ncbi:GTP cyclohydrolase FolE2 [Agarivorans aestuarii]|uniref:GTP cyclohydrolase FolE2 n=1 Tax=Agarivorans aestuarii TaxID=1563703 RepID=A0ABU7G8Y9_9ALTE|nr:GTP cyclohydrolase FolE2 [Agarivorans aestuarii]MEE1675720.1 GTP cyclohydrolase FolE2 [Agarivorans aestuarii]